MSRYSTFQVANLPTPAATILQRWSSDYLQTLQQRQRWLRTYSNLQPGYILLLREDNTTPLHWSNAMITDIHKGKEGNARVVTLRKHKGIFKRLITKICPLQRANDEL